MTRAEVLATRLHEQHMAEFTHYAEAGDDFTADQCGNCQRWAKYALAAQEGERLRASLARGLEDSAAGRVTDLGDFTEHLSDQP